LRRPAAKAAADGAYVRSLCDAPTTGLANVLAIWLWLGWIANYWIGVLVGCSCAYLRWYRTCGALVAWLAALVLMPRKAGVSVLGPTVGAWIISRAAEYFALRVTVVDERAIRASGGPMIFAIEPHDVLPVSMAAFHASLDWIPGHRCAGLMTSAVFSLPGMKSVFSWMSAESVDRDTFGALLAQGRSVCFCPGGVQEVMHLRSPREVVLFLNARLGFARLALQHRAPAVPCFTFGLGGTYSHRFLKGPVAERLARTIGFLPGVYWGLGAVPFGPPRPLPLSVVVGRPVPLPSGLLAGAQPSAAMVAAYHEAFVAAMRALFEAHKTDHGMAQIALRII
jgi:2-acylglycerol O-acyltransferase 2